MTLEEEMKVQEEFAFQRGMDKGIEQGRSEGEKSGIERGAAQKEREIAKNFKKSGIPFDVIVKNTGLTLKEVEEL